MLVLRRKIGERIIIDGYITIHPVVLQRRTGPHRHRCPARREDRAGRTS